MREDSLGLSGAPVLFIQLTSGTLRMSTLVGASGAFHNNWQWRILFMRSGLALTHEGLNPCEFRVTKTVMPEQKFFLMFGEVAIVVPRVLTGSFQL